MLNIQEVVNFLNEHLNTNENITFNVKAEVGESDKESLINGILRTANSKTTPIANYVENRYTFVVELSVPTARTNKVFLKAQDIVSGFVDDYDGTKVEFTNGNGAINCSLGKPETFKVAYNVGDCTPLYFTIDMIYTENGVMSVDKKWYLNGLEIPYESESVVINKEGITRKVDFDKYTKTLLTGQTKFYKFKFPYQNTELGNMLMKDILNGDFKKQYTLKYVDGINYIEDSVENPPFETKVSIFMSGDANSQVVNVGKFDITFTDVDDGNTETKYYLGLIDWQFDLSGEDTAWFDGQNSQQTYFEAKVNTVNGGTGWQQIKAPNLNSIYITSQVFPNENNLNVFDLVRKNYAIIKVVKTEDEITTTQYIYYRATNCQIGANGQVTYDLKEDTVQTIFINPNLRITDSFIEKCHGNRYIANGDGTYSYNFRKDSLLFEKEPISSVAKRTSIKNKLNIIYNETTNAENDDLNIWLNNNVKSWVYIYLSDGETYNQICGTNMKLATLKYTNWHSSAGADETNVISSSMSVLCYPLLKRNYSIRRATHSGATAENSINSRAFTNFITHNDGYAHIYAIKYSIIPPFFCRKFYSPNDITDFDYEISGGNNQILTLYHPAFERNNEGEIPSSLVGDLWKWGVSGIKTDNGTSQELFMVHYQDLTQHLNLYAPGENVFRQKFTKAQARENPDDPKLYNEDYSIYNVYFGGQTYQMPISKTSPRPAFKYYEILSPDVTKFYITYYNNSNYGTQLISNDYSIFNDNNTKDYTGLVGTLDLSMWFSKTKLDEWLATNKNNLQIFQNNQNLSRDILEQNNINTLATTWIGAASGIIGGLLGGNANAVLGGVAGGLYGTQKSYLDYTQGIKRLETEATNRDLTIDNMRQSPSTLSALNSNSLMLQGVDDFGIYIEMQEPIDAEKEMIKDYLKRYGYTINRIGNIKTYLETTVNNVKVLTRIKYVYIKAIISSLSNLPISAEERMDLKQRFENGIRFWNREGIGHDFVINYNADNHESYLDET